MDLDSDLDPDPHSIVCGSETLSSICVFLLEASKLALRLAGCWDQGMVLGSFTTCQAWWDQGMVLGSFTTCQAWWEASLKKYLLHRIELTIRSPDWYWLIKSPQREHTFILEIFKILLGFHSWFIKRPRSPAEAQDWSAVWSPESSDCGESLWCSESSDCGD